MTHIALPFMPLLIIVAHAPHSGQGQLQITWWKQIQDLLNKHGGGNNIILLIDANVQATYDLPHVGELGESESSEAAQEFGDLLRMKELQLPSTFANVHDGDTTTWTSNDGLLSKCLDYIGIPLTWSGFALSSWVDSSIDSGAGGIDHSAVCLQVSGTILSGSDQHAKIAFDRNKIASATPDQWEAFYHHWPDVPWTTPPTMHADILNREIQQRLAEHFPIDRNRTRRGIIFSSSTWRIHAERGRIRRILTAHGKAYTSLRLHCALRLWTSGLSQEQINIKMISYALKIAATYTLHGQVQRDLRRFIDHDRAQYLRSFAGQLDGSDKATIMKRLKPLKLGKRVKDLTRKPIPMVFLENGEIARTANEATARWRRHYAAMEGGTETSPMDLWKDDIRTRPAPPTTIDLKCPDAYGIGASDETGSPIEGDGIWPSPTRTSPLLCGTSRQTHLAIVLQTDAACKWVLATQRRETCVSMEEKRWHPTMLSAPCASSEQFTREIISQRFQETHLGTGQKCFHTVTGYIPQQPLSDSGGTSGPQSCHSSQAWWIYQLLTLSRHCTSVLQSNSPAGLWV